MTPEQINIAIAESLGWRLVPSHDVRGKAVPDCWIHDEFPAVWADYPRDYTADLNAMHEVIKSLDVRTKCQWFDMLYLVCTETPFWEDDTSTERCVETCNSTALQRAEAYLRTIGKWNEKD